MLVIAEKIFQNGDLPVSIGTKHPLSEAREDITVLLGGRVEFNSFIHRRDAWDVSIKFNIYCKRLEDGMYEAGLHNPKDKRVCLSSKPTVAVSEMAYRVITEN